MELEAIMEESIQHLQTGFYDKPFKFSYSSLNKLMFSPAVFYQLYVMGIKEEKLESYLVQGKIIHALLLEEKKFNDQFIISPTTLPTSSLRTVVDRVYGLHLAQKQLGGKGENLQDYETQILEVMKDMNYFQNLKTDQQRIDKIITPDANIYWSFLVLKGDKTLIDQESYDFCKSAVDIIKVDPKICELICCNQTDFDNKEVYNELYLECELAQLPFGLKGILDNLVIDHDKKTIFVNDIKTTSKDLKDFKETVDYYAYWLQASIYMHLVVTNFELLIKSGYQVKFHFVVIDRMFQVYPFYVTDQTLIEWDNRFMNCLEQANWHYTNKDYSLPHAFATGSVVL